MSEDLHDIDDIFRNDIEGHREELPPGVWDAVSSHLDQQQATYYRQKYRRLKRATVFLLGLCLFAVVFVVVNKSTNKAADKGIESRLAVTEIQPNKTAATGGPNNKGSQISPATADPAKTAAVAENSINATPEEAEPAEKEMPVSNPAVASNKPDQKQPGLVNSSTAEQPPAAAVKAATINEKPFVKQSKTTAIENSQVDAADQFVTGTNPGKQPGSHLKKQLKRPQYRATTLIDDEKATEIQQQETTKTTTTAVSSASQQAIPYLPHLLSAAAYRVVVKNLPALPAVTNLPPVVAPVASNHKRKSIHLFSLSAFATPNLNFSRLEDDRRFYRPGRGREDAHREEQRNGSFSAGLLLNYQFSSRLSIQSGIGVSTFSTSIDPKTIYAAHDNAGRIRYELPFSYGNAYLFPKDNVQVAVGDSAKTSVTNSKLTYVNIPLALSYAIGKGRLKFYPTIGTGLNILTSSNAATSVSAVASKQNLSAAVEGLRSSYLNGKIGFGAEYEISRKISLGMQPNINFALTPINRQTPVKAYQNFFSLQAGIRLKL